MVFLSTLYFGTWALCLYRCILGGPGKSAERKCKCSMEIPCSSFAAAAELAFAASARGITLAVGTTFPQCSKRAWSLGRLVSCHGRCIVCLAAQEKNPNHFGNAMTFFTSTGRTSHLQPRCLLRSLMSVMGLVHPHAHEVQARSCRAGDLKSLEMTGDACNHFPVAFLPSSRKARAPTQ